MNEGWVCFERDGDASLRRLITHCFQPVADLRSHILIGFDAAECEIYAHFDRRIKGVYPRLARRLSGNSILFEVQRGQSNSLQPFRFEICLKLFNLVGFRAPT